MKQLAAFFLILSLPLIVMVLWVMRSRLGLVWRRLGTVVKLLAMVYVAAIVYRLANSEMEEQQMLVAGGTLAFFGGVWLVAWLVTRLVAKRG